jgi:hypothetical protein
MISLKKILREYNAQKAIKAAVDYFGYTNNPNEAGYLLPNGKMLDLSGKKHGGSGNSRDLDHREIVIAFDDVDDKDLDGTCKEDCNSRNMINFMNDAGTIRLSPQSTSDLFIDIGINEPTKEQYNALSRIIRYFNNILIELSDHNGDSITSKEFGNDVDFRKPNWNKIKSFIFEAFN